MPIYEWICRECKIYWDRECSISKAPKRTKCPECSKLCDKYWQNANVGISFGDDGCGNRSNPGANDFHTVKRRYQKHAEKGYDKDSANKFLHRQIKASRESQDEEVYRYKSMNFNYENMEKDGLVTRLSDKEAYKKKLRAKRLTEDAYNRANKMGYKDINKDHLDITKPQKQG